MRIRLRAIKPDLEADQGETLGAHLRRRRRELVLTKVQATTRLGVSYKTLTSWEQDEHELFVHLWPAVVAFLAYEPWGQPTNLADRLIVERRRRGLSIKQAALIVGVDEGTLARWECGAWKPTKRTLPKLDAFTGISCRDAFPGDVR